MPYDDTRRQFLSSLGVCIALPALESFAASKGAAEKAKTFVAIGSNLGWYQKGFYPKEVGTGYLMPEVLEPLGEAPKRLYDLFWPGSSSAKRT